MLHPLVAWVALAVGLSTLAVLSTAAIMRWAWERSLPPLRGEPVGFPAVPTVPADPEEQRVLEALVAEREAKAMDAREAAEEKRRRRAQRKQNVRIPRPR